MNGGRRRCQRTDGPLCDPRTLAQHDWRRGDLGIFLLQPTNNREGLPVKNDSYTRFDGWVTTLGLTVFTFAALWVIVSLFYALR